jgi:hypothetical protein
MDKMDSMQKGKAAEKIVEKMFKEAGFRVFRAGYESTFKGLADRYNLIQGPAAKYIRHHPDFIVVDKKNYAYLIEVKFRRFGLINQGDLFNYPETQVILLTRDSMHCQYLKDIHKNGKKFLSLNRMKPFSEIPEKILRKYILKTRRVLGDENLFGQLIEKISEKAVGKIFTQPYTPAGIKFSYVEDYNKEGDTYEFSGKGETISGKGGKISYSRDKSVWNDNELNRLKSYFRSGKSISDIAANLGRKKDAVVFKLARLGVISMGDAINLVKGKNIRRRPRGNRGGRNRTNVRKRSNRPRTIKKGKPKIRINKIIRKGGNRYRR